MNKDSIIKTLIPWNFWGKEMNLGISREDYIKEALLYIKANKILTITGPRRSGKSFIAVQIANTLIKEKQNSLIINFEEARFDEELNKNFLIKIYDSYLSALKPTEKPLIILDEVQEVEGWERFVRSVDEKKEASFIVTGSSGKVMSEELATLLTGRTLTLEVFPLTFKEFLQFKELELKSDFEMIKHENKIKELLYEYSSFGGFPEIALEKNEQVKLKILSSYYEDIITKDIVKRFNIRRIDKLERIVFHYLTNFSSLITFNSIGKYLKLDEKIVEIYSKYIEQSKLAFFVKRFSSSLKEQENSPRKVYLIDVGFNKLSNVLFSDKVSKIYENIAAIHLLKKFGTNFFYWKDYSGKEVDFVIKRGSKVEQLIQVSWNVDEPKTKERETKALLKASRELKCDNLIIITEDKEREENANGSIIKFIPLWKWLLEK